MRRAFILLLFFLVLSLCMILTEMLLPHANEDARLATRNLISGRLQTRFWGLAVGPGLVLPILLMACFLIVPVSRVVGVWLLVIAPILALAGVWWFEEVWIKAGQSVPLS